MYPLYIYIPILFVDNYLTVEIYYTYNIHSLTNITNDVYIVL